MYAQIKAGQFTARSLVICHVCEWTIFHWNWTIYGPLLSNLSCVWMDNFPLKLKIMQWNPVMKS